MATSESTNIRSARQQRPGKLPAGAWDSHVHVVDEDRFPFHSEYPYRPKKADYDDLIRFERSLGIDHVCIVAMSVYSTDNRSILDALKQSNGTARGVVCIDPHTIDKEELAIMHELGARGVRVNLKTRPPKFSKEKFAALLQSYASKIRHLNWALQLYISLPQLALIAEEIPKLGVPVVLDHLVHPDVTMPPSQQEGYAELIRLLQSRQVWVKLSATYRFSELPELDTYVRDIISIAPTQVVWASDWPHSGGAERIPSGGRHVHQDYRKVDDAGFVTQCMEWCGGDEDLIQKIWVDNPRRLWQYEKSD